MEKRKRAERAGPHPDPVRGAGQDGGQQAAPARKGRAPAPARGAQGSKAAARRDPAAEEASETVSILAKLGGIGHSELTPQREVFAQAIAAGMRQSAAYRLAYRCAGSTAKTIHEQASRLAADDKVAARVAELREHYIRQTGYELRDAMQEADRALVLAQALGQIGAAAQLIALKAKLNGLMVEERRNERSPFAELSDEELRRVHDEAVRAAGWAGQAPELPQ